MTMPTPSASREFAFSTRDFKTLAALVGASTGIVLADHKRDMVYSRLARRVRALGLQDFQSYCELVQSEEGGAEMGNLVNAITTNLTSFFRESHHFEHLQGVLAGWKTSPSRQLRLWSAGCSSGMEAYSMAMTMADAIPNVTAWNARILATDIDTNMLRTGAAGEYAASELSHIPPNYAARYLTRRGDRIRVSDDLRKLAAFKPLNLLEAWPMKGMFDIVFCRNVVIYFDKPTQTRLFARIADLLKPDGWLYIGHSENLHRVSDRFELVGRTIYRKVS